jgi:hypothetical protein
VAPPCQRHVLGHASPVTTKQIYAHMTLKVPREWVRKYGASRAKLIAELEVEDERRRAPA